MQATKGFFNLVVLGYRIVHYKISLELVKGGGVQLVSRFRYAETEQLPLPTCHLGS